MPSVWSSTSPDAGAVHRYQTDEPTAVPLCHGLPISLVAPDTLPVVLPVPPGRTCAAAKLSFAGVVVEDHSRVTSAGVP